MRTLIVLSMVAAVGFAGCQRKSAAVDGDAAHGRYAGIGTYPAGGMWKQLVAPKPANDGAARLSDDEQIIVVVDSRTGEVRQCGNISGYCVGMSPWANPLAAGQSVPVQVTKHGVGPSADEEAAQAAAKPGAAKGP